MKTIPTYKINPEIFRPKSLKFGFVDKNKTKLNQAISIVRENKHIQSINVLIHGFDIEMITEEGEEKKPEYAAIDVFPTYLDIRIALGWGFSFEFRMYDYEGHNINDKKSQ